MRSNAGWKAKQNAAIVLSIAKGEASAAASACKHGHAISDIGRQ